MTGTLHATRPLSPHPSTTTSFPRATSASPHKLKKRRRSTSALHSPSAGGSHKRRRDEAADRRAASDDELSAPSIGKNSKVPRMDGALARLLSNDDKKGNETSSSSKLSTEHGPRIREVLEKAQQLKWERYEAKAAERGNMAKYTALNEVKVNGATAAGTTAGRPSYSYGDNEASSSNAASSSSKRKLDAAATPEPTKQLWTPEVKTSWPSSMTGSSSRRAKGLQNLGNTCFANSILQIFVHTPAVLNCLETMSKSPKYPSHMGAKRPPGMTSLLNDLRREVWGEGRTSATNPKMIIKKISQMCPSMRLYRQEDAHEFFRGAIDSMQDDALRVAGAEKAPHDVRETTWVHKVWGGKIRSRVLCTECNKPSDTYDTFLDLSLDVKRQQDPWHLKDALAHFSRTETLQGKNGYKCENCKKIVRAEKSMKIVKAPPVLSLHLKRFGPMGGKIKTLVKYSHRLDLTPYTDGLSTEEYELYGVTIHSGSGQHSGHYYSYVRGPGQGKWYEANDETVRSIDIRDPLNKTNAYVLHYIRRTAGGFEDILAGKPGPSVPKSPKINSTGVRPLLIAAQPQSDVVKAPEPAAAADDAEEEDLGQPVAPTRAELTATSPRVQPLISLPQSPLQSLKANLQPERSNSSSSQKHEASTAKVGVVSPSSFYGAASRSSSSAGASRNSSTATAMDYLQANRSQHRDASRSSTPSRKHSTQAGRIEKKGHQSPYPIGNVPRRKGHKQMLGREGQRIPNVAPKKGQNNRKARF